MNIKMKNYQSKLSILTLALLISLGAQAGNVGWPDFIDGDTLNAAQMNEVKDEVNDNDGRITTNAADINTNATAITAITAAKILIACSSESNFISSMSSTTADIESITITVPSPGTIYVSASGMARISGSYNGSSFQAQFSITNATATFDSNASNFWGPFAGGLPSGISYDQPIQEIKDFVVSAGTHSFFFTGRLGVTPTVGTVSAGKSKICAQFIPD